MKGTLGYSRASSAGPCPSPSAATSTRAQVIAAVNLTGLLVASSGGGTGDGTAITFAATNLAFGDDGVNLSNTDTATAITSYISTVHAARPAMLKGDKDTP